MIGELLLMCGVGAVIKTLAERDQTKVERGRGFLGGKYRKVTGPCFRCGGTGTFHGHTCNKCGGSGRYSKTTWH